MFLLGEMAPLFFLAAPATSVPTDAVKGCHQPRYLAWCMLILHSLGLSIECWSVANSITHCTNCQLG